MASLTSSSAWGLPTARWTARHCRGTLTRTAQVSGVPMGDIHIRRGGSTRPCRIINRYHLRLPSNLGLLVQHAGHDEGVALKLDPDFDIWGFSEPYRATGELAPGATAPGLGPRAAPSGAEWSDLLANLPRTGNRLLEQAERGELLQIGLRDTGPIMRTVGSPDDPDGADLAACRTDHQPGSAHAARDRRRPAAVAGDDWLCRGDWTDRVAVHFDPERHALKMSIS